MIRPNFQNSCPNVNLYLDSHQLVFRGEDDLHARGAGRGAAAAHGHEPTPHAIHADGETLARVLVG